MKLACVVFRGERAVSRRRRGGGKPFQNVSAGWDGQPADDWRRGGRKAVPESA